MIQDVDEALRALVRREALGGADVDVAFEAPTRDWSARRNAPTLDLYLYDIREDLRRREVMWQTRRDPAGLATDRRPPPRHYKLSYLVTAWTQRPEDEHRLLSAVLACFVRHERLPDELLAGSLAGSELPVFATIALPPPTDRPLSDIWSALGGELKPSLDLVVTAPLTDARQEAVGPPVLEEPRIRVERPDADSEAGPRRRRSRGAGGGDAAPEAEAALPDETRRSGTEAQPGRTVRLRVRR
jgi:Pvc16 N-terminal domain